MAFPVFLLSSFIWVLIFLPSQHTLPDRTRQTWSPAGNYDSRHFISRIAVGRLTGIQDHTYGERSRHAAGGFAAARGRP